MFIIGPHSTQMEKIFLKQKKILPLRPKLQPPEVFPFSIKQF